MTPAVTPGAAQHGGGGNGSCAVVERHPAIEGYRADLHAESADDQPEDELRHGEAGSVVDHIGDTDAAVRLSGRQHGKGKQKQRPRRRW